MKYQQWEEVTSNIMMRKNLKTKIRTTSNYSMMKKDVLLTKGRTRVLSPIIICLEALRQLLMIYRHSFSRKIKLLVSTNSKFIRWQVLS
jgi:hypothetical protein